MVQLYTLEGSTYLGDQQIRMVFFNQVLNQAGIAVLLLAEAIVYWRLRNKSINRKWARLHVIPLFVGTGILPILFLLFMWWSRVVHINVNKLQKVQDIRTGLVWGIFVIAHIFFVMMLIEVSKKRKAAKEVASRDKEQDGPDLLEDYADT